MQKFIVFDFSKKFELDSFCLDNDVNKRAKLRENLNENKFSNGKYQCLDLHGFTRVDAEKKFKTFIINCKKNKQKKLLIITGRGLHSGKEGAVLKKMVEAYLSDKSFNSNISWKMAPLKKGGEGAFLIKLP